MPPTTPPPARPPKWAFLVPYRDREPHRFFFQNYMTYLMEDHVEHDGATGDYLVLFVEQMDARPFNRGAMKNIGFLAIKGMFPDAYKDVVLVFNDVDVLPYTKNLLRHEPPAGGGTILHHYGFEFALGGIFSIRASDFEKMNGFANYWTWGFEDNLLQNRAQRHGIHVDRSNFFPLNDMRILHINDGYKKSLNRTYMYELISDTGGNGISTLQNVEYDVDLPANAVRVRCFDTEYTPWNGTFEEYDLRNGREIHAPLSKEMMLDSARSGNRLETLRFLDSDGKHKTTAELVHEHEREQEEMRREKESKASKQMGFMRAFGKIGPTAHPRPGAPSTSSAPSALSAPARAVGGKTPMMMSIRKVEERRNTDSYMAVASEQRTRHYQRYGAFGLAASASRKKAA